MPIINPRPSNQSLSLPPVGEYAGFAKKVETFWSKANGSTESHQVFRIPLTTHTGHKVTAFMHLMDKCGYFINQMLLSGELIAPEGNGGCVLTTDQIENRKFYFAIEHKEWDGVMRANVKFHTPAYAIRQNPDLEKVSFPGEAPRGIELQPAPGQGGEAPPVSPVAQTPAPDEGESLTEEEFRNAWEEARRMRKEGGI